jgi:transcriptional regulator with XRE-family HTH domain
MSVATRPFSGFSVILSNDRIDQNNFVCLSEADRVRDEDRFVIARAPDPIVEHVPVLDDSAWTGLDAEQTLGQLMTESRKRRGLSREQVASETNIPQYYVRMIESDRYDAIPDQLYLLPYFERYAIFLGLDARKVVSRFIHDFEKSESELVEAPATRTPHPVAVANLLQWRRIAEAAVIVGVLLPSVGWEIGAIRAARHQADHSSGAAVSSGGRPSPAIAATDARPNIPSRVSVQLPGTVTTTAGSSVVPQVEPPPHAQTRQRRRSRIHRLSHYSRHSKRWSRRSS